MDGYCGNVYGGTNEQMNTKIRYRRKKKSEKVQRARKNDRKKRMKGGKLVKRKKIIEINFNNRTYKSNIYIWKRNVA